MTIRQFYVKAISLSVGKIRHEHNRKMNTKGFATLARAFIVELLQLGQSFERFCKPLGSYADHMLRPASGLLLQGGFAKLPDHHQDGIGTELCPIIPDDTF